LPPLPVGTAPNQQQQLEHPRVSFAENLKQPVFERIILKGVPLGPFGRTSTVAAPLQRVRI